MLTYTLKKTPGHPLYEQLYQSIRDDIAAGRLPAGSRCRPSACWPPIWA